MAEEAKSTNKNPSAGAPKASASAASEPDENNLKVVSAVGYLGILFLLPMLMYPKSKFAMFHANQGLLLLITSIALQIVCWILVVVSLGFLFFLPILAWVAILILFILGLVNALTGKMQRLPIIGKWDLIKVQQ